MAWTVEHRAEPSMAPEHSGEVVGSAARTMPDQVLLVWLLIQPPTDVRGRQSKPALLSGSPTPLRETLKKFLASGVSLAQPRPLRELLELTSRWELS